MQIRTASAARYGEYQYLLKKTCRLHADGVGDSLERSIATAEAGERARYDRRNLTCILVAFRRQRAVSWAQLLPTVGPSMSEPALPHSLASGSLKSIDRMIGRFLCVNTSLAPGRGGSRLQLAKLTMFGGIIQRLIVAGYERIAGLRFKGSVNPVGWLKTRVREPVASGNTLAIASPLPRDRASLDHFSQPGYRPIASGKGSYWFRRAA
ncbi:acyl-homoserine-lactone synthase [Agrobacterium tumefaciens]|uniref:acyl-homoserine-lactone synthase n=1 Tax=Agrobacterium tumefaciens TaxID=358 RepID=UPI000978C06C|nr:hypothetical protein BV900_14785 [Agrobacterium tumefaciens]